MNKDTKNKSLFIEMPIELHNKIKVIAAERNITLKKLIIRLIIQEIKRIEDYK